MAEPYPDLASHLRDELRRVWLRVEYEIRLSWARARSGSPTGADADAGEGRAWTPEAVGHLFAAANDAYHGRGPETAESGADEIRERLEVHARAVDERTRATLEAGTPVPLLFLATAFELTTRQWHALMFALLPEIDPSLVLAYRYLARDASCRGLDGRLLASLVYDTPESRSQLARDLSPSSPLVYFRLLDVQGASSNDSLLFRRIRPASRLVQLIDGTRLTLDPELAEFATLRGEPTGGMFPAAALQRAAAALRSPEVALVVQGQRGIGKKLLLQLAAAQVERGLLVLDGRRIDAQPQTQQQQIVRGLLREVKLFGVIPTVADVDDVPTGEREDLPAFATMLLQEHAGPIAFTVNRDRMPRIEQRPLVHVELAVPPSDVRALMWKDVVPGLTDPEAAELAAKFAVPGGIVVSAAQAANASRARDQRSDGPALIEAVAGQLHQRIQRLGKKLPTPHEIDALVVDDDTRTALLEIEAAVLERRTVREKWGMKGAAGLSVLFSGHPGVGKTMSGTVLARRLGLDVYEIDLSQVMSKWLGETEKNLADLFDAAEPGHVVLLFNEADSLFGKRTTEVKNSNDRYANMETNYLLQRLERFGGLAILTTNLASAIDPAFKRRFSYDVYFSFPSPDLRAELWRRTLPVVARADDVDFDELADDYELSGGFIKVACERAAYLAAAASTQIDTALLRRTVERMYRERGKLSPVGPLE